MEFTSKIGKILDGILDRLGVDWIVEQGVFGSSQYRKWASGKAEVFYHTSYNTGVTTQVWVTPIYYQDYATWNGIFGDVFIETPHSVICTSNNSQIISVIPYNFSKSGINTMRIITVGAKTSISYAFSVHAIGRWK